MKYISVAEMRNIDIQTDAVGGVSFAQLMENAGRGWDENGIPAQEKLTELGLNTL